MKPLEAIRCTLPSCPCECFSPAKTCLRTCDSCKHGWVAHAIQTDSYGALDKLGYRHIFNVGLQVEIVQPNIVFDIASLMLYGAQATPIRLKILLDRLFSVLQHEEVLQVLHGFGWTYEDYARGYILQYEEPPSDPNTDSTDQESSGRVLDKWTCATREEEYIIMQQFLRFGETKSIAQEIILQDTRERQDLYIKQTSRNESEIKKFIERSNMSMQNLMRPFDVRHLFGNRLPYVPTPGSRLMSPPITGFSTPATSPRSELRPPLISVTATSPVTSSPLGRLQTMQPFDYRRETSSPAALSPSEKSQQQQQQQSSQPQQLMTRENSPKTESPQNLSLASTSAQSSPSHTPFTPQKISELESPITHIPIMAPAVTLSSMILPTIRPQGGDDAAIKFSIKEDHDLKGYMDRKNKHLRKSSNPIKRNWFPDNFGSPMIGPNGKKRVLCTACNKTFCDKGALKIHYSAVHLKEMHKCSVDGCTMMFSSRRSRNRHSANPNPKLHMPQKRPKVPEGATLVDDGTNSQKRSLSTPPTMVMSSMVSRSPISMIDGADQRAFYSDPNIQMPLFPTAAKRLKLDQDDDNNPHDLSLPIGNAGLSSCESSPQNMSLPALKLDPDRLNHSDADTPTKDSQEESLSEGEKQEMKLSNTSSGPSRTASRRKNIPTRCAQPTDLFRMQTDCKSNVEEVIDEDGNRLGVLKHNGAQGLDVDVDDDDEEENVNDVDVAHDEVKEVKDDLEAGKKVNGDIEHKMVNEEDIEEECSLDKSDSKLVIDDEEDEDDDIDRNDTGEVLDFSMHVDVSDCENMSGQESNGSFASNDSQDMSKNNGDLSSSDYDIPLDKDNPKQCITCGKSFLNVFGLKIHYKNVHLKLMHNCTVAGCSAAFPSKRSRDRHSANLNLHRKLLSTTAEDCQKGDETDDNQNFRADVIQKLYENQNLKDIDDSEDGVVNGNDKHDNDNEGNDADESSDERDGADKVNGIDDELGCETPDGMVSCHICKTKVRDNLILKEHFELNHPREMYQCKIKGCEKIFTTRKSRNRHSQNDNLHKIAT